MSGKQRKFSHFEVDKTVTLIEQKELSLYEISKELHCSFNILKRELEHYYGLVRCNKILHRYRRRKGFKKNNVPPNKGKHYMPPALIPFLFKKGDCLRGNAARNWVPIGALKIRKEYVTRSRLVGSRVKQYNLFRFIKVADKPNQYKKNWMRYCRYVWQQHNGVIPERTCVVHLDMDTLNDSIENLALMKNFQYCQYLESRFVLHRERKRVVQKKAADRRIRLALGDVIKSHWECTNCAAEFQYKMVCCPKCGKYSIEQMKRRAKVV